MPNLDEFEGRVIHSHVYRHPEDFRGEKVAVVGGGSSGLDIMLDVAAYADNVNITYISTSITRNRCYLFQFPLPRYD